MSKTIIWLEDDTNVIDPVVRPLERAGYTIVRFNTVEEALQAIDQIRTADLLLLDMIHLPPATGEDFGRYPGLTVLRQLRETHGVATPVVVFSVVSHTQTHAQLRELGVADIIRKPVLPSELKRRVEQVLEAGA